MFVKWATIVGARPQFVKVAAVTRAIGRRNRRLSSGKQVREILVHTGQHYDYLMDRVFFEELQLPKPDHHLGVGSGSHAKQTGLMMERIEAVLMKERPDLVIVYGDTNSTLAGALVASKLNLPLAHVEAGLRSYNRKMPEELNRVLTDHLSGFLFCPTLQAVRNLSKEGMRDGRTQVVKNVGDVMYDSILYYSEVAEKRSTILRKLDLSATHDSRLTSYCLATLHRAENTDDPDRLKSILEGLDEVGKRSPVILPLHPRTKKLMESHRFLPRGRGLRLVDPVSYLDMLKLEKHARAILTDSGGVQKEAFWLGVPCLTLRDETEWVETVECGWNSLVGAETERIVNGVRRVEEGKPPGARRAFYGDGRASEKIVGLLTRSP